MNSSSSAEIIGSSEDLLTQILIRLPVRPLLRFKSVSKRWLSLISSPQFSRRHTLQNPTSNKIAGFFLRKSPQEFQFLSLNPNPNPSSQRPFTRLNFVNDPAGIKILQSCNGFLLCSSLAKIAGTTRKYYVYNPTTNQFLTLPSLVGDSHGDVDVLGMNLAFDPCKSFDYKVICVRSTAASVYHYQIENYSSEIGAWRLCGSPFVASYDMVFDNGVFWNGAIHWISPTGNAMCFDVDRERIAAMPNIHPSLEEGRGKRRFRYFGEFCGHLYLIQIYGPRLTQFNVLELAEDYSKWSIKYLVDLNGMVSAFPEIVSDSSHYTFVLLFLLEQENQEESSLLLHIPGKIISYNLKDKTFKTVLGLAPSCYGSQSLLQFGWHDAYQYIETLACV